ncbi:hypothetical protein DDY07_10965 [Methylomonas sp. ZR1]|nr:hypothetical protein [Methylomonas sp. ZR1]
MLPALIEMVNARKGWSIGQSVDGQRSALTGAMECAVREGQIGEEGICRWSLAGGMKIKFSALCQRQWHEDLS